MKHDQYKELLHLSFFQELDEYEHQILGKHLKACVECQSELEGLKKLGVVLEQGGRVEVDDHLLNEARRELRIALRLERAKTSPWSSFLQRLNVFGSPGLRFAYVGAAMLVIGFSIGYFVFIPSGGPSSMNVLPATGQVLADRSEPRISNFRFVRQSPEGSEVELSFDMVTPVRMKGNINDNAVQRVMAQALLSEQNPGARLMTVSTLADQVDLDKSPDKEIESTLIQTLKSDANVGVRKEALKAIQKYPFDNEIKSALLYVLRREQNPSLRIDVINYFEKPVLSRQLVDQDILNGLKESMQSDNNNYIRTLAKNVYEEVKQ